MISFSYGWCFRSQSAINIYLYVSFPFYYFINLFFKFYVTSSRLIRDNLWILYFGRYRLAKIIPNLRPWEVLSIEQAMDLITCEGEWFREPLGSFTTGPPYIQRWNKDVKVIQLIHESLNYDSTLTFLKLVTFDLLNLQSVWYYYNFIFRR